MQAEAPAAAPTGPVSKGGFSWAISIKRSLTGEAISSKHLLIVTSQLSVMLAAGCDLCAGLEALARQQAHPTLKKVLIDLHTRVKQGQSFSAALARNTPKPSPISTSPWSAPVNPPVLLRQMLAALADHDSQQHPRGQLHPRRFDVSGHPDDRRHRGRHRHDHLRAPALREGISRFSRPAPPDHHLRDHRQRSARRQFPLDHPWASSRLIVGGIWLLHQPAVRDTVHKWILKFPLLGQTLMLAYVCRSIQTMGMLIKSGLPLAEALVLTRDMMPNIYYWKFYERLRTHITEGKSLSADFEATTLFPPMVTQMMSVGEQTGTLAQVCNEVASFHEEELQSRIKVLTTALEPMIIVVLGGFVGFIAVSIILPMFKLSSTVH